MRDVTIAFLQQCVYCKVIIMVNRTLNGDLSTLHVAIRREITQDIQEIQESELG